MESAVDTAQAKTVDIEAIPRLGAIETSYLAQRGVNARTGRAAADKALDDVYTEMLAKATTPRMRAMLADALSQRIAAKRDGFARHEAAQVAKAEDDAAVDRAGASREAMLTATTPEERALNLATGLGEIAVLGKQRGWDVATLKAEQLKYSSGSHAAVIRNLAIGQDQGMAAARYLAEHRGEIDVETATDLTDMTRKATTRDSAMRLADTLGDRFKSDPAGAEGELRRQYEKGDITADVRDAASQRMWQDYSEARRLVGEAREDQNYADAQEDRAQRRLRDAGGGEAVEEGGVRGMIVSLFPNVGTMHGRRDPGSALGRANPKSFHNIGRAIDLQPIPGVTFNEFVGTLRAQGLQIVEAIDETDPQKRSKHATGPHWHIAWSGASETANVKTDNATYGRVLDWQTKDPAAFANGYRPDNYSDTLSPADARKFARDAADMRTKLKKGDNPRRADDAHLSRIANPLLQEAGYKTGDSKEAQDSAGTRVAYMRQLRNWQDDWIARYGKPPSDGEIRNRAAWLLVETTEGRVFEAQDAGIADRARIKIPETIRSRIVAGLPPDQRNNSALITRMYRAGKGRYW